MSVKKHGSASYRVQNFADDLASIVQFHRKKSGLTLAETADLAGVGKSVVFDLEHSKPTIQLDSVLKILNVLNIHLEPKSPIMESFRKNKNEER